MSIIGCTSSGFKGKIVWNVKFDLAISASYPSFLIQPHLPALLPITHHIKGNPCLIKWLGSYVYNSFQALFQEIVLDLENSQIEARLSERWRIT